MPSRCGHTKGLHPWPHRPPPAATCRLLVPPLPRLHAGSCGICSTTDHRITINRGRALLLSHTPQGLFSLSLPRYYYSIFKPWRAFWVNQGGFCNCLGQKVTVNRGLTETVAVTASVNRLTVVVGFTQPPRLIHINRCINRGGCLNMPALVQILTEAVS